MQLGPPTPVLNVTDPVALVRTHIDTSVAEHCQSSQGHSRTRRSDCGRGGRLVDRQQHAGRRRRVVRARCRSKGYRQRIVTRRSTLVAVTVAFVLIGVLPGTLPVASRTPLSAVP